MKVGVYYNPYKEKSAHFRNLVQRIARAAEVTLAFCPVPAEMRPFSGNPSPLLKSKPPGFPWRPDYVLALGGDGTFLAAARSVAIYRIPIFGVNIGKLGFLTNSELKSLPKIWNYLKQERFQIKESLFLQVKKGKDSYLVLNDCVISNAATARVIFLEARVNDEFLSAYAGDGIIVATPIGSTAYSLAAGGPIISPELSVMIITPICPHTLGQRPLVIADSARLRIIYRARKKKESAVVSLDGQYRFPLLDGEEVEVKRALLILPILNFPGFSYFDLLRRKLNWGGKE